MKNKKVECKCQTCSKEPNGYKEVSKATRTRHRARDKRNNVKEFDYVGDEKSVVTESTESYSGENFEYICNEEELVMIDDDESVIMDDDESVITQNTESCSSKSSDDITDDFEDFEELPPGFTEALRLLEIKSRTNMTDQVYREVMSAFSEHEISLYCASKKLEKLVQITPVWIDCCIRSCYAFTGNLEKSLNCPKCKEPRYILKGKNRIPRKRMAFFPLKDRFFIQYQDPNRSQALQYRYNYTSCTQYINEEGYGDIFDGKRYKELFDDGFFPDYRDIALTASIDGYQIFKQKTDDCWVVLFINANLKPQERVKRENLLIGAIIPGPNAPSNFNSFLYPVIEELKSLEEGIKCYDGAQQEDFILRCSVVSWSGDMPALAKLMCTTGHNSYEGCRYCKLRGTYHGHVYFPTTPPKNNNTINNYNSKNLPKKNHTSYLQNISILDSATNNSQRKDLETETGVTGKSILFKLKSTLFPDSFALDIMHLLYENIPGYMFKHWNGNFYANGKEFSDDYVLPKNTWSLIGEQMEKSKKTMPTAFGRPPRNILTHHEGFKAEEWANWVTLYSLPLLKNYLPPHIIKGWKYYVNAVRLCQKKVISNEDLATIQQLILAFYQHYEKIYYQYKTTRLPSMKMCFHYLLHLVDSIQTTGPCWATWQFPMERLCGMLLPLVRSKLHPYQSLINNITLNERFNHLQFYSNFQNQVFSTRKRLSNNENMVYTNENYIEELHFPSVEYIINKSTTLKLKRHYLTAYENTIREVFPENGIKYARLRNKNGIMIGSMWGRRNKDFSNINYTVAAKMSVDIYASQRNRKSVFKIEEFYGCVEYYMVHKYKETSRIVAFIQWTNQVTEDKYGLKVFKGYGAKQFIDVCVIDRCVGFLKVGNVTYVIDKVDTNEE